MYLASQEGAQKYLCPHLPAQTNTIKGENRFQSLERPLPAGSQDRSPKSFPDGSSTPAANAPTSPAPPEQLSLEKTSDVVATVEDSSRSHPEVTKQKDPKSFTQNLFDTTIFERYFDAAFPRSTTDVLHRANDNGAQSNTIRAGSTQSSHIKLPSSHSQKPFQRPLDRPVEQIKSDNGRLFESRHSEPTFDFPNPRQTLSHFSMQNVKALVSTAQKLQRGISKEQSSSYAPNQATSTQCQTKPALAPVLSFARQSISYVLSTPQALLASFREHVNSTNPSSHPGSIDFGCMVQAFHWLAKIDTRPSLVMSSLATACKKLDILNDQWNWLKNDYISTVLEERDVAHIAMLVFAALVATIPPCNLEVTHMVWKCHQSGSMVPHGEKDPDTIRSVLLVLDAFEDEMALTLLSRLCQTLALRMNVSHAERLTENVKFVEPSHEVVRCLLDHLFDSQQCPSSSHIARGEPGSVQLHWRYDLLMPDKGANEDTPRYLGMIAEWLRWFIVKKWDGKMDIDRLSAVGSALEILWWFGKYSLNSIIDKV